MNDKSRELYISESSGKELNDDGLSALIKKLPDKKAVEALVEGCQSLIMEAAAFFETKDVYYMDLVQEGNLALFMLFTASGIKEEENPKFLIDKTIKDAMFSYCDRENSEQESAKKLRDLLNTIDAYCRKIAEEEGREVSSEELSKKLNIDEGDVKYLMRIALSAIDKK